MRPRKLSAAELQEWIEERQAHYDPLHTLSSSWQNAERGVPASCYSDTRERRIRFTKCKICQRTWNPDSATIDPVDDTDSIPYEYAPRLLFKKDDLCRDCLSDIETKS